MKRKIFSGLLAVVLVLSFSLVTAVPATPAMADKGTNYSPFGTVLYIWGTDQGGLANVMKWWFLGGKLDGAQWDDHQITIVNSQCPEFDGQWYMKNTGTAEMFTLWRDAALTDQVTTTNTGLIGDWDTPAAYAIDGWVVFNPAVDTVGDPRETVTGISHMYAGGYGGFDTLQVSLPVEWDHLKFQGWYLELVECGWDDLNGGWFLNFHHEQGAAAWYELYADAEFMQIAVPNDPEIWVPYGGTPGYLSAALSGRFVAPYEVWVDDGGSDTNPGTKALPFATIQKGIDMVASGGTVTVAPGIYNEDVTIDEDLTLNGAQAGVDARGRDADESHITGSIYATSAVDNVVIDGFKVTVTVVGPWSNTALIVDSETATIQNNIVRGVETTGPFTRSGIVDLDGVKNATISQNDLELWLHPPSAQNGFRLGLADDANTVVIDGNRVSKAAGGGIGIMNLDDADASVQITENVLTNNGDGMWLAGPGWGPMSNGTFQVEYNTLQDNDVQVRDLSERLNLDAVLASNIFDRAVVVRGSGIKVPIIFSSIQDAVNVTTLPSDTVDVADGPYTEDVLVDVEGITIKGESLDAIVDGGFILKADNITIDGLTIKNGMANTRAIITPSDTGPTYGSKGHRIVNNDIIGPSPTGASGYWAINIIARAEEPVNILVDKNKIHGWRVAIMLEGYTTTIINNELYDNSKSGIEVERSCNNRISRNDIHDNGQFGIRIGKEVTTGNAINFNNIWGNGEYGVLIDPRNPSTVDATMNWWDSDTGPKQATTNPDGKGNPVSGNVDYMPWLTRNFQTVLDEGIGYYGWAMAYLKSGWNILSTPYALDDACDTWGDFITFNGLPLYTGGDSEYVNAYSFDSVEQGWGQVDTGYVLTPCDAIYVRMAAPDIAALLANPVQGAAGSVPTKKLEKGWNLVGLSWMPEKPGEYAIRADYALGSVKVVGSLTGYTQVVSPWMNQDPWTFVPGMEPDKWSNLQEPPPSGYMEFTKGYWVFMENGPDYLAGSWFTPMGLP